MEDSEIKAMLNYPDSALVEHAIARANLTDDEWEAIELRVLRCKTIESAAEGLLLSSGTVKNRYRSGMDKLNRCWSALPWVNSIIK